MVWTGLLVYALCFVVYFIFVSSSSKDFYLQNLIYYDIASELAQLLVRYRMLLAMSIEGYQVAFTQWFSKYYKLGINPELTHTPVFGSDYFPFIEQDYSMNIRRVQESYMAIVRQINDIDRFGIDVLNRVIWGEGISIRDYQSMTVNRTYSRYPMSPDPSICIPIQINNMIKMERVFIKQNQLIKIGANWTRAQARPFFVNELAGVYENFIFVVVNSYISVLPNLENSQSLLFGLILNFQVADYNNNYLTFIIILLLVTLLNWTGLLTWALMLNNGLGKFYSAYILLKSMEVDSQQQFLEERVRHYQESVSNEMGCLTTSPTSTGACWHPPTKMV